jgi:hypothetical protein
MSFTIKCNKCGGTQEFTSDSSKFQDSISINAYIRGSYMGDVVEELNITCENPDCNNDIDIKF